MLSTMVGLTKMKGRFLHPPKRPLEIQAKDLPIFKPISMMSNQTSINTNVPSKINIRIHIQIHPDKLPSLGDILTHWVLLCLKYLITCAREIISNLWIQLPYQIHFQGIGTQTYIAISIKQPATTLMIAYD
jgi:hypothetical protein